MLRHVMTGAAAVLTVGMLAVGCSDDGDTIINGNNGPLNNNDNFPASSIFANQVSVDGGGVSPNDTNIQAVRVIWSCDICWSDGNFQGDSSALVVFTTIGGNNATNKLWVSHYNGQTLTQPITLIGVDQDEQNGIMNAGGVGVLNSVVALQLNTQNYFQNNQNNQQNLQTITQNDKVWVLLYSATTFTNNPANATTQVQTVGSSTGRHRTIYYTAFRPGSRNNNLETRTDFIGNGTTSVNLQFGWVLPAIEVVPANARSGVATDGQSTGANIAAPTPSSDVQSFGLISDGFAGQTQFSGTGQPLQGTGALGTANATNYVRAVAQPGVLGPASYNGGEQTQIVHLFYTQILNSLAAGGGSVAISNDAVSTPVAGGARLAAFNASFNLATLQFETPVEFNPAVRRNATTSLSQSPGTGFFPTFFGYNAHVFYKYADASLQTPVNQGDPLAMGGGSQGIYDNTGADAGGVLSAATFQEDVPGVATFQDDGDGTSSLVTGSTLDLTSFNSVAGQHDTVNPPATGTLTTVNREVANFNTNGVAPFIFGADESLGDTTIFYSMADNTSGGTGDLTPNTYVRGGYAAAINNGAVGTLGSLVAGSPFAWSTHAGAQQNAFIVTQASGAANVKDDPLVAPGQLNGGDGNHNIATGVSNDEDTNGGVYTGTVNYFVPVMNRSGEYVSIGYMQDTGISSSTTSASFHRGLKIVTYQAFQTFSSTSSGSAGGLTQVNLNLRFSAPQEISQTGATVSLLQDANALTGIDTNAETNTRWDAVPVSNFTAQSLLGYRCAFQSNNRIIHYLWEQSDATGDRGWSRQITYVTNVSGTPSAATLGTIIEYETGNLVSGHLNTNDLNVTSPETASFTFLDGNLNPGNGTAFYGTDLGAQDQNNQGIQGALGTNAGSLIVFFHKITDGTSTDGDFGNVELITNTVIANTLGNRISLGRAIDENLPLPGPSNPGQVSAAGVQNFNASTNSFAGYLATASTQNTTGTTGNAGYLGTGSFAFLSLPNNSDLVNNSSYQPNSIYIYFTGPSGTNGSSFRALLTRKLDLTAYRQAGTGMTGTPGVTNTFITPSAGTTGPGSVGFLDPTRLDHNLSAHVFALSTAQNNTSAGLLWRQDDHVYGQGTNDGIAYVTQNGGPNPPLVDQDSKTDVTAYALWICTNNQGDAGDGIITLFKLDDDTGGDNRLQIRAVFNVSGAGGIGQ